ncbi:MAG: helix-turn-helix transcriptional regulator [Cyanobacteria bacterium SBLK]|nr:helix-turn-helix transcriptional regulator [Cyanobacteria bacterium SBLK]
MKHGIIFKTLWQERKSTLPSQKEIARKLDIDQSFFSRFLKGKQDIRTHIFLDLVRAMPEDFQIEYWRRIAEELEMVGLPPFSFYHAKDRGNPDTTIAEIVKGLGIDVKMLKELLKDIPKAVQASIPSIIIMNNFVSTIAGYKLTEMIRICVEGKTEKELKARIEFLCLQEINWERLQDAIAGNRYPQTKLEIQELKILVDPPYSGVEEKYSFFEWMGVFLMFDRQLEGYRSPFAPATEQPENQLF